MEVRGQQPGGADEARARFRRVQSEISRENRARVQRARELLEGLSARRHEEAKAEAQLEQAAQAERGEAALAESTRAERSRVERAASQSAEAVDRIEISSEALAAHRTDGHDDERAARVEALREAYTSGTLNDADRVERAATRMLGGADAEEA